VKVKNEEEEEEEEGGGGGGGGVSLDPWILKRKVALYINYYLCSFKADRFRMRVCVIASACSPRSNV
jgi:hypothetical protein